MGTLSQIIRTLKNGKPDAKPGLYDRFGRRHNYLRISVTDRCNFRCLYCMPPEGIPFREREEILTYEEILRVARVFADLGIDKIRITGGEPTVRRGIETLIQSLSEIPGIKSLLMTTNGITLSKFATMYREAGLTGLNISLDTLQPERFKEITRRDKFSEVMKGIETALNAGYRSLKMNVVVMAGVNDDEILDFVEFVQDKPITVRFIEFMPFKSNGWSPGGLYPYAQMKEDIATRYELKPIEAEFGAVSKDFSIDGFQGSVGFITSMSENFCSSCNRVRLTADGQIKSCLFSPAESNLRDFMRAGASDTELEQRIRAAMLMKPKEHAPMEELVEMENRSMIEIGG